MIINPIIPIWCMLIICAVIVLLSLKDKVNLIKSIIVAILLFLINIRFMIPAKNQDKISNDIDVLFVIDETVSMIAEDYDGNTPRLEAVKKDCKYIIDNLAGARFALITFDNSSQLMMPFSTDQNATSNAISALKEADILYARGSSLNVPLKDMKTCLENVSQKSDRRKVVFFITDGEMNVDEKLNSYSSISKYIDNGAVLGYGTSSGGRMKDNSKYAIDTYLKDDGSYPPPDALSKIDEKNLKKIASDMNIEYIHMDKQKNIDKKLKDIKTNTAIRSVSKSSASTDIYYIFVIMLCIVMSYELIVLKRRIAK